MSRTKRISRFVDKAVTTVIQAGEEIGQNEVLNIKFLLHTIFIKHTLRVNVKIVNVLIVELRPKFAWFLHILLFPKCCCLEGIV